MPTDGYRRTISEAKHKSITSMQPTKQTREPENKWTRTSDKMGEMKVAKAWNDYDNMK